MGRLKPPFRRIWNVLPQWFEQTLITSKDRINGKALAAIRCLRNVLPQWFEQTLITSKDLINGKAEASIQALKERASTMIRAEAHHQCRSYQWEGSSSHSGAYGTCFHNDSSRRSSPVEIVSMLRLKPPFRRSRNVLPQWFEQTLITGRDLINWKAQDAIQALMERASTMIQADAHHQYSSYQWEGSSRHSGAYGTCFHNDSSRSSSPVKFLSMGSLKPPFRRLRNVLPQWFDQWLITSKDLINGNAQTANQALMECATTMIRAEAHHLILLFDFRIWLL
jgi:hypothetical protein